MPDLVLSWLTLENKLELNHSEISEMIMSSKLQLLGGYKGDNIFLDLIFVPQYLAEILGQILGQKIFASFIHIFFDTLHIYSLKKILNTG